jgi:hypothetical protein
MFGAGYVTPGRVKKLPIIFIPTYRIIQPSSLSFTRRRIPKSKGISVLNIV